MNYKRADEGNCTSGGTSMRARASDGKDEPKVSGRYRGALYPSVNDVNEVSKLPGTERLDSTSVCSSASNSALTIPSSARGPPETLAMNDPILRPLDDQPNFKSSEETGQNLFPIIAESDRASDEQMGSMLPTATLCRAALDEGNAPSEEGLFTIERIQAGGALEDSSEITNSRSNDQSENGNELVQATLIRDVEDMHSNHSETDPEGSILPTSLTRETSVAAVAVDSDIAVVEAKPLETEPSKVMSRKLICAVMGMLLIVIGVLSVGFVVSAKRQEDSEAAISDTNDQSVGDEFTTFNDTAQTFSPSSSQSSQNIGPAVSQMPVLKRLRQGGSLRCGVIPGPGLFHPNEGGEPYGFDAALCAAVAAAATGDPERVEFIQAEDSIFIMLNTGAIDIASAGITHTMERQVYQADAKTGFAFTNPYLYQGMQLAGEPELVDCGDRGLESIAACPNIRVCVIGGSTHEQLLSSYLPGQKLVAIGSREELRNSLADGICNVIAHEGYNLAESLVREAGFTGDYKVGMTLFSKEPLAMVTASGDPKFADFANSIVQALVVAEFRNITQATAQDFEQTNAFGEYYKDLFRRAVAAGGHYGELYSRYMEPYSTRQGLNLINDGSSRTNGLLYSHPFGTMSEKGASMGETVQSIKLRGRLRCGVRSQRVGFAEIQRNNTSGGIFRGMEVDYCRAIAGSIFEANGNKVDFVEVADELEGYAKLAEGDLDLLAGASLDFVNDVNVTGLNEGFTFTQPYFFGTEDISEPATLCLATREGDHHWSSFVYWVAAAIVKAEETNITQGMSNSMPPIYLFGENLELMLQDAVLTVGNYHEMYERNLEHIVPRAGRNLLNGNVGPQLYPISGMIDPEPIF